MEDAANRDFILDTISWILCSSCSVNQQKLMLKLYFYAKPLPLSLFIHC
jgi:hypothetical protein